MEASTLYIEDGYPHAGCGEPNRLDNMRIRTEGTIANTVATDRHEYWHARSLQR